MADLFDGPKERFPLSDKEREIRAIVREHGIHVKVGAWAGKMCAYVNTPEGQKVYQAGDPQAPPEAVAAIDEEMKKRVNVALQKVTPSPSGGWIFADGSYAFKAQGIWNIRCGFLPESPFREWIEQNA